jgi:hypothetical protein
MVGVLGDGVEGNLPVSQTPSYSRVTWNKIDKD